MILRLLNWQGIAGIAVASVLLIMLTVEKLEIRPLEERERAVRDTLSSGASGLRDDRRQ